ncbi:hypothetical protein CHUAL_013180 [Chamberlinius hualienensis]
MLPLFRVFWKERKNMHFYTISLFVFIAYIGTLAAHTWKWCDRICHAKNIRDDECCDEWKLCCRGLKQFNAPLVNGSRNLIKTRFRRDFINSANINVPKCFENV